MKTYAELHTRSNVASQLAGQAEAMRHRLADVRHVVAVMSGKGGVGKSTLAANLAAALIGDGKAVGLVDGDINGPSIGRIAGVAGYEASRSESGLNPAIGHGGLRVMSIGLFLAGETAPVVWDAPTQKNGFAWRGLREAGALRSLIADTNWGALDYLVIDLPPGSDKLGNLVDLIPKLTGAVAVTIPSAVSAAAVGKSIHLAKQHLDAPILGLIENMGAHVCAECGHADALFPAGSTERLARDLDLPILARIPFDPLLAASADRGSDYVTEYADRPAAHALRTLAARLDSLVETQAHER